jgi:hypothetical protein
MPKADIKAAFRRDFPSCYQTTLSLSPLINRFAIVDSASTFYSFNSKQPMMDGTIGTKKGRELMNYLLRPVFQFFKSRDDQCDVVFLTHDISKHVPVAKASTQSNRNASKEVTPLVFNVEDQKDKPIITLEGAVPDWAQLCANREAKSYVMQNIHDMIVTYYTPPSGKYLVLDGEFAGIKNVPCVIYKREEERVVDYISEWKSVQGEGDIRIFTIMNYIIPQFEQLYLNTEPVIMMQSESNSVTTGTNIIKGSTQSRIVIVNCVDTDVQCISILQSPTRMKTTTTTTTTTNTTRFEFAYELYIKCGEVEVVKNTGETHIKGGGGKRKAPEEETVKRTEYLNSNAIFTEMANWCTRKNSTAAHSREWVINAVRSLVMSACMGEMDFNDGYSGLSHNGFYEAYKDLFNDVGLLVEDIQPLVAKMRFDNVLEKYTRLLPYQDPADTEKNQLSVSAQHLTRAYVDLNTYVRLLKAAYYTKHQRGLLREHKVKSYGAADWETIRRYVVKHTPNSTDKRVPEADQIYYRYQRFQWMCFYWILCENPEILPLDELKSGWKLQDESKGHKRSNIVYK